MPLGANSQALPSACMMNGSSPARASGPVASGPGRAEGSRSSGKSGLSLPVQVPCSGSHHTSLLRSLHGLPSGSAEALL